MMNKHTYAHFDTELEALEKRVVMMGELACRQVVKAFDGFALNSTATLDEVIETDKQLNREEVELDELVVQLIARNAPAAADLRMLVTILQMVIDLERVGDEAKKIAKAARPIVESESSFVPRVELRYVANLAVGMLSSALDAFVRKDPTAAAEIERQDKQVDAIFRGIMRQLATYMMEDPRLITRSLDVLFIAKSVERIGDHATNVAEHVVYMVKGRDVRHQSIETVEKIARNE